MRYPQGIRLDIAAQAHDLHARSDGMLQSLSECRIGLAVRREHAHAGHLNDENGVCFVTLRDALFQAAEVLPAAFGGGVREHAYPCVFLRDTLDLREYAAIPRFDVEVEPGVTVGALRADDRFRTERLRPGEIFGEDPVRRLGVDVDQQIALPCGHEVVTVPPSRVVRFREDDAGTGQEDLPASAGVLDVDADLLPVDEDGGDEPVLSGDELRLPRPGVEHEPVKNRHY